VFLQDHRVSIWFTGVKLLFVYFSVCAVATVVVLLFLNLDEY
jgi:hypothetical protein